LNNQLLKGLNIFLVKKETMIDEMQSGLLRVAQTTSES
jgi:hypothetical protein